MSSRCHDRAGVALALGLAVVMAALTASCEREERDTKAPPESQISVSSVALSSLQPGEASAPPGGSHRSIEENAFNLAQGKQLYTWFNCSGCHAHGGGDIGPALMDDQWLYGSEIENVYATIVQGRPNGMPSFRNRIPDQQVWQIAAYVRSMSGLTPATASPSRSDEMQNKPAEQSMPRQEPKDTHP
jgi:cytochrome c oxidase cbb3-type subunit III